MDKAALQHRSFEIPSMQFRVRQRAPVHLLFCAIAAAFRTPSENTENILIPRSQ